MPDGGQLETIISPIYDVATFREAALCARDHHLNQLSRFAIATAP
jgi:hypothetical protein